MTAFGESALRARAFRSLGDYIKAASWTGAYNFQISASLISAQPSLIAETKIQRLLKADTISPANKSFHCATARWSDLSAVKRTWRVR